MTADSHDDARSASPSGDAAQHGEARAADVAIDHRNVAPRAGDRHAASPGNVERPATLDRWLRIATIVAVLGVGAFALAQSDTVLRGALAWFAFLMCVLSGWGYFVVRIARVSDVDFGLRAAWGIAGYLAVAGVFVALGVCSRPVILTLVAAGAAGFAWRELVTPRASWRCAGDAVRFVRARPALGGLAIALVVIAIAHVVGAAAALGRSPWDDDLAYTPFARRLLDTGDLVEPFSFRRLGAYGGQSALHALAGARGSLANIHLLDQGIGFAVALLALVGYARERKTSAAWLALLVLVVELLPNTAINTAAYWSGAALLFALYRTIVAERWALVGVVGAATCTLRQNYLPIVVIAIGGVLLAQLIARRGERDRIDLRRIDLRRIDRRRIAIVAVAAVLAIAGWWIAMYRSSDTFLFPLVDGTFNPAVTLRPSGVTWASELGFLVWCAAEPSPIVVVAPLFLVLLVVRDRRPGMPLRALFVGTVVGFVALVHAFAGYEAHQLWRYSFAPGVALLAALVLEIGASDEATVELPSLGRWVVIVSLVVQLVESRTALIKYVPALVDDVRNAAAIDRDGDPSTDETRRRYAALQASIPVGATVAVMLDDPYYLDFARNRIVNLDIPGYASPARHLPAFNGPGALQQYLVDQGIRYVAFVRSSHSRYVFRRPFWIWRLFHDAEPFQAMSAYSIDMIDTLATLATQTPVLHDVDGFVVLDLDGGATTMLHDPRPEPARRAAFVRTLADRDGLHAAWSLNSRADLLFEDGVAAVQDLGDTPLRPISRRAHLRVRGTGDHRLRIRGGIHLDVGQIRPRVDVTLAGELVASTILDEHGDFAIDLTIAADRLGDDWRDLYLVWSGVAEARQDSPNARYALLESVEWEPR
jgi:hypothetical protein